MTRRRLKIKSSTKQSQQNNPSRQEEQLSKFAKKIVNDANNNGIGKIYIRVGGVGAFSEIVNHDKIIVSVPSSTQSNFLEYHINGLSTSKNPLQIEHIKKNNLKKSAFKKTINSIKGPKDDEDDGTGIRRGKIRIPNANVPDVILPKGIMPKAGMNIKNRKKSGPKKPFVHKNDGTRRRTAKTPPEVS